MKSRMVSTVDSTWHQQLQHVVVEASTLIVNMSDQVLVHDFDLRLLKVITSRCNCGFANVQSCPNGRLRFPLSLT